MIISKPLAMHPVTHYDGLQALLLPQKVENDVGPKNGILVLPVPGSKDATYKSALLLVARIDSDLTRGTGHYWTKAGVLLYSLDQVVRAILAGELMEAEG